MSYVRTPALETVRMNPYTGSIPGMTRAQAVRPLPGTAVLASRGFGAFGAFGEDITAYCAARNAVPGPDGQDCTCKKNYVEDPARDQCSVVCKPGFHADASRKFCIEDSAGSSSQPAPQPPNLFGSCPPGWSKDPVTGFLCLPPLWTNNQNLPCPEGTMRDPTGFACWPTGNLPSPMPSGGCPAGQTPDDLTGTRCVKNTIPGPTAPAQPPIGPGSGTAPPIGPQPPPAPPAPSTAGSSGLGPLLLLAVVAGGVYLATRKKAA